jgi:hypothetical protein
MTCPYCKKNISSGALVCPKCTKDLRTVEATNLKGHQKAAEAKGLLGCLGCLGVLGVMFLLVVGVSQCPQRTDSVPSSPVSTGNPRPSPVSSQALAAFEASPFCTTYQCVRGDTWSLSSGGDNHTYKTSVAPSIAVEIQTEGDFFRGAGVTFYERSSLTEADYRFIESFLRGVNRDHPDLSVPLRLIRGSVERKVFQIDAARSVTWGDMRVRAGKVGNDQIVSVRPVSRGDSRNVPSPPSSTSGRCGGVGVGDVWDEALPKLNRGTRTDLIRETPDRFTDVRDFDGTTCRYTFERPTSPDLGPYRVIRVR